MAEAGEEAPVPPVEDPEVASSKAGACPDFAVVCSFLERYGAALDLPELTFPELEEALEESGAVSKALVELHLKLMRKIGKSVTFDRWEKYLVKICQDYNSTWAWEMEKKGYQEMSVECKVGFLKHLCECQFDDNLKFKNAINEEDADAMRIQPIGRDKDGLMYWYQLDQDHNVRMYIEELDDQDGSTWKCIVRTRNDLAETLELLKAQIDPALLKKSEPQESSSQEGANAEDGEGKKQENGETPEEEKKVVVKEEQPDSTGDAVSTCPAENGCKPNDMEPLKTIGEIKSEPPDIKEGKQTTKDECDSFKENVKPVKVDTKNEKTESKDLKELKGNSDKIPSIQEPEHSEISVIVKRTEDPVEKSVEDTEKMKNDQQAKIPLKKRELKLTDDFDGPIKASLCKSQTPTKELLQKEDEKVDDGTKTSAGPVSDGKQMVNGEVNSDKPHKAKLDPMEKNNPPQRESVIGIIKEENGIIEKRTSSVIKSLHELKENSRPKVADHFDKSAKALDKAKTPTSASSEESSTKTTSKEVTVLSDACKASVHHKGVEEKAESTPCTDKCTDKKQPAKTKGDLQDSSDLKSAKNAEVLTKDSSDSTSAKNAEVLKQDLGDSKSAKNAEVPQKDSSDSKSAKNAEVPKKDSGDSKSAKNAEVPKKDSGDSKSAKNAEVPQKDSSDSKSAKNAEVPKKDSGDSKSTKNAEVQKKDSDDSKSAKNAEVPIKDSDDSKSAKKAVVPNKDSIEPDSAKNADFPIKSKQPPSKSPSVKESSQTDKTKPPVSEEKTKPCESEKQDEESSKADSESNLGPKKKGTAKSRQTSRKTTPLSRNSALKKEESSAGKESTEEVKSAQETPVDEVEENENKVKEAPEMERKTFSLRSKRRGRSTVKESDNSIASASKEVEAAKVDFKDKPSEKSSLPSKNKRKLEPPPEEDNSGSESKEMTSERQKEGIKLTIRISNKRRRPELPVESTLPVDDAEDGEAEDSIGRRLRRSPRISRPSVKVVEVKERKPEKKQDEEEEEEEKPVPPKPDREEKKSEKEPCQSIKKQKPKQRRRARWTNSRSRRKRKSSSEEETEESDSEEDSEEDSEYEEKQEGVPGEDDEPCKKCGLPNHPELILLCDSCDSGYHTACLRPPLMLIPDGEWFCPPCQHKLLCEKLEEQLQNLDVVLKKKERAVRRRERLVYVGISIENIIPTQEQEEVPQVQEKEEKKKKKVKPLERRSTRARKFISYRFDEFDEAIDEAIEDDIRDADGGEKTLDRTSLCVEGAGRGKDMSNITGVHRGKDISTIIESERTTEGKRPQRMVTRRKKRRRLNDLDSDSNNDEEESEDEFRISEGSQDEFVVSEENVEESEDQQSNDSDFGTRRPRRHYQRPVRKSTRIRKRARKYSDDDDDDESDEEGQESETEQSSDYSDDYLETRRRRSRRNQARQVNYREESESDASQKAAAAARHGRGKEMRRILKRRVSSSESNASDFSGASEDEKPRNARKHLVRKRIRSSNDELSDEEPEKPVRKRLNRIETDDEDEEEDTKVDGAKVVDSDKPATEDKPSTTTSPVPESTKKHTYRIESDEDDDFENVTKDGSPLDYSLVDLPSANGQSPGKTIETLIGKPSEKGLTSKDATAAISQAPNGTGSGSEAAAPEEDEDELLRVTDLVDYVCNSEQL